MPDGPGGRPAAPIAPALSDPRCVLNKLCSSPSGALPHVDFPKHPDQIDIEFLSAAVNATVKSFEMSICGSGAIGCTVILKEIVYADTTVERPTTLALKMSSTTEDGRLMATSADWYQKEVRR